MRVAWPELARFLGLCEGLGDPAIVAPAVHLCGTAAEPSNGDVTYFRWHGSPVVYRSSYSLDALVDLASQAQSAEVDCWCIFDNTALGRALANALDLHALAATQR